MKLNFYILIASVLVHFIAQAALQEKTAAVTPATRVPSSSP
jgi:hypothetical protein